MENHNSNNSKDICVRTEESVPSISHTCLVENPERTFLENEEPLILKDDVENGEKESNSSGDNVNQKEKPKRYTRHQKLTFAGFAFVLTTDLMLYSVLAPFYPVEAQKKGVSTTVSGLVFGVYALISFIASPIIGKYITVLGPRFLFFSGTFLGAGCNLLFGVLDGIEDTNTFIVYCFLLRSVESLGASASVTAGMTITATVFPDNVAQMTGFLETFSGLGLMIGPALGGVLYKIGGYKLPFLVLGALDLLVLFMTVFIIPDIKPSEVKPKPGSLLNFMMIPVIWPMAFALVISACAMTFLDPTLSLHLETFGVSTPVAGVLFLLIGGLYALTMPLWGYLSDKYGRTRIMAIIGFGMMGASFLLVGPSPLLHLPNYLWIVIVSLSICGISIGCACMPIFLDMMVSARWYGFPDDMATNGLVSGFFSGCFSLGSFLGPVVGGILKDKVGFNWASTYVAASCFAVVLVFSAFCLWEYQCGKGRRKPWRYFGEPERDENENQSDTESLQGNHVATVCRENVSVNADTHTIPTNSYIDDCVVGLESCRENGPWIDRFSDKEPLIINA
ncbi:MFS-type transporter SLC18B1-like [Lytechinus variegatus]|uniref:MFS-type transporter SLC18B1-like n=1 Tax=Lytechinus variegatus TaxID=7654 RepID=UPI001BB16020|nr:MFS-type transporter SLC18B1-like [Lytechinus variegatus]XP_041458797.1 MFS-type transporter SLC18B1-like [Lytechinus variegatus]XP_041458798.1 MFS-type transporter SLC18B1-like [Lytechinus variegatus]XP_041458799.1 MFS-type transporter SLC18B1-like [Lytechinus variegatus]